MTTQRLRDAILIVFVVGALVATGWAFLDLGRRLPDPPPVHQGPVPEETAPYENAANVTAFTDRSPERHLAFGSHR